MGRSLWGRLLILVLLGRLALVLVTVSYPDGGILVDSEGYLRLARTIEKQGTFIDPEEQDLYWPPGYPMALVLVRLLFGRQNAAIAASLLQLVLSGGSSLLLYRVGREMGSPSGGLAAAWIFALSPHSALWSLAVMSETLFAFLLVLGILLWLIAARQSRWLPAAACGMILAAAALVRPIGLILVPLWAVVGWAGFRRTNRKQGLPMAAVLALSGALVIGIWVGRNWLERGYLGFSMLSERTFYNFNFAQVFADSRGISRNEAAILVAESGDPARLVLDFVRENPGPFLAAQLRGILRTLVGDESSAWARFFGVEGVEGYGILSALLAGDFGRLFAAGESAASGESLPFLLPTRIYGILYTVGVYILAAAATLVPLRSKAQTGRDKLATALILLTTVYLLLAPAGAGQARFRIAAEPLLALLAGMGAAHLLQRVSLRRGRNDEGTGSPGLEAVQGDTGVVHPVDEDGAIGDLAFGRPERTDDCPRNTVRARAPVSAEGETQHQVFQSLPRRRPPNVLTLGWANRGTAQP